METKMFDQIISRLPTDTSRRRLLGALMGAATAALASGTGLEAKPKKSAKKRRQSSGGGAATAKVAICHFTNGRESAKRILVGRRALKAHLAHGDDRFVDCCVNEDCDVPECYTAQCGAGTCSQTQLPPEAPCFFGGGGALGNCTADGQCLPTGSGGG